MNHRTDTMIKNREQARQENKVKNRVEQVLKFKIENFNKYYNGFSFTVKTELNAYKSAYIYRYCKKVTVKFSENLKAWSISVYTE